MATTENTFDGDGSKVQFPFTFEYLKTSDVKIGLKIGSGVEQILATDKYEFPNATTLKVLSTTATDWQESTGAPKNTVKVRVHRKTSDDNVASTFYPGSAIRSSDLNDNFLQNLYVTQEARNITTDSTDIANEAKDTADAADAIADAAKLATDRLVATTSNNGTTWTLTGNNTNASTDPKGVGYSITTAEAAKLATDTYVAVGNTLKGTGADGQPQGVAYAVTQATAANGAVGDKIAKDGSTTISANIPFNSKKITGLADPTAAQDGATKAYVDAHILDEDDLATNSATKPPSQQSIKAYIATTNYTKTEADAKYFTADTETIDSTETWDDADNRIATTKAIDNRVTTIVQDVGGFVPIANETSFPNTNPDVNNGAGTLVSIKALASSLTSNGSGVATIANGNIANSATVTINGLDNSTTYAAGYGMIVETTSTLHTYAFHRLLAKATEVTSVNNNSSNINTVAGAITNINTVAGNNTNITAVADNESNIDIVAGELTYAEDLGLVSESLTSSSGNNIDTVAGAITNINTVAGNNTNITTVAGSNSNVTSVAGSIANVNTVATNITNVNSFSDQYKVAGSAPGSPTEGDLWYDSGNNVLKYHNGSSFVSIQTGLTNIIEDQTPELYAALDCNDKNLTEVATISGTNLQIDFGTL